MNEMNEKPREIDELRARVVALEKITLRLRYGQRPGESRPSYELRNFVDNVRGDWEEQKQRRRERRMNFRAGIFLGLFRPGLEDKLGALLLLPESDESDAKMSDLLHRVPLAYRKIVLDRVLERYGKLRGEWPFSFSKAITGLHGEKGSMDADDDARALGACAFKRYQNLTGRDLMGNLTVGPDREIKAWRVPFFGALFRGFLFFFYDFFRALRVTEGAKHRGE